MQAQHIPSRLALAVAIALASSAVAQVGTNYTFASSTGTYSPITGTVLATATSANVQDDVTFSVPLPFTFQYDGAAQSNVFINTNGWLAFGSTSPGTTNYAPLSVTAVTPGFVAAMGRDMSGGFVCASTRTLGSDQVTGISALGPISVGDVLVGTGIPIGATVLAIAGNTLTMSAVATANSAGTAMSAFGPWSNISWELQGTAPNQVFIAQWSNWKRFGTTLTTVNGNRFNFQICLYENGNIEVVYGDCSPGVGTTTTVVHQAGLRGPTNAFPANINSRQSTKGATDWATSLASTGNGTGHPFNAVAPANFIPNGLTYLWTPPVIPACSGTPAPGLTVGPTEACSGVNFALSLQNTTPGTGVTYQWFSTPTGVPPLTSLGTAATQTISQTADTWYFCNVTCGSATTSSTALFVPMSVTTFPRDFEAGGITGNCWSVSGTQLPFVSTTTSGYGVGTVSAKWDFWNWAAASTAVLTSPTFTPTVAGTQIYFDVAGAQWSGGLLNIDQITLEESVDGGTNWTPVVVMTNGPTGVLRTAAPGGLFTPTASQWASLAYPLSTGANRVRFAGLAGFGSNVHLDNISVGVLPSARHSNYGISCVTPDYLITAAGAPISPSTYVYTQTGIPEAAPASGIYFGVVILSLGQNFAGTPLNVLTAGAIDSPCNLHVTSLDLLTSFVSGTPTDASVSFSVPAGAPAGILLYSQAAALIVPVAPNNAGIVTSNAIRSYINSF